MCVSMLFFFFKGTLNVYLRLKSQTSSENPFWSTSGNKGQHWFQARVNIHPNSSFQVRINNGCPMKRIKTLPVIIVSPCFLMKNRFYIFCTCSLYEICKVALDATTECNCHIVINTVKCIVNVVQLKMYIHSRNKTSINSECFYLHNLFP